MLKFKYIFYIITICLLVFLYSLCLLFIAIYLSYEILIFISFVNDNIIGFDISIYGFIIIFMIILFSICTLIIKSKNFYKLNHKIIYIINILYNTNK